MSYELDFKYSQNSYLRQEKCPGIYSRVRHQDFCQ